MTTNDFKKFCYYLRNAAPEEWDAFVEMFNVYTNEAVDAVVDADSNRIWEAQGAAKQCRAILNAFLTCDTAQP